MSLRHKIPSMSKKYFSQYDFSDIQQVYVYIYIYVKAVAVFSNDGQCLCSNIVGDGGIDHFY